MKRIKVIIVVVLSAVVAGTLWVHRPIRPLPGLPLIKGQEPTQMQNVAEVSEKIYESKTIIKESQTIPVAITVGQKSYTVSIVPNTNLLGVMKKLQKEQDFTFTTKTFSGLGEFVESINGIANNSNQYWMYYIDGNLANIGVSQYTPKAGDIIVWKFEKSF